MPKMRRVEFHKACDCFPMTATAGRHVLGPEVFDPDAQKYRAVATFYPGPVCDVCDTPWKEVKHERGAPQGGHSRTS